MHLKALSLIALAMTATTATAVGQDATEFSPETAIALDVTAAAPNIEALPANTIDCALEETSTADDAADDAADDTAESTSESADVSRPSGIAFTPMTRSERLRHYLASTFGAGSLARATLSAETGQLTRSPKEWGRDPGGYSARFGSAFAHHVIRGTLEYGASGLLHEDNRYLRSDKKGFWKRTGYALVSSFLTRHDNGKRGFAFSRIGSAGGAAFIVRAWLPRSVATLGAGASSFGITVALDAGSNVLREFWPDLKRRFRRN
jgi:hypothetical protein